MSDTGETLELPLRAEEWWGDLLLRDAGGRTIATAANSSVPLHLLAEAANTLPQLEEEVSRLRVALGLIANGPDFHTAGSSENAQRIAREALANVGDK